MYVYVYVYVYVVCVCCCCCCGGVYVVLWCCVFCVVVCGMVWCCVVRWCGAAWHAKKKTCRFKTPPCVPAKRPHVFNMRASCRYTRRRFECTHGGVLDMSTGGGASLLSFSSFLLSLPSLFSSFVLFLFLFSLFSSLSVTMTMITRPVGSLCVHTALTCQSVRVHGPWPIPCWPNMLASCKKQLSWYNCASLVPLGMKWACICAGNGCCVWWCLVVLVCVCGSMW